MNFEQDFESILAECISAFNGVDPSLDFSPGTFLYTNACAFASVAWGIYHEQELMARNFFPDLCDSATLQKFGARYSLLNGTDTDAQLLAKIQSKERQPAAGGNENDYYQWAYKASAPGNETVRTAKLYAWNRGPGSLDLVITSTNADEVPTANLIAQVQSTIDPLKPAELGNSGLFVVRAPTKVNVSMEIVCTPTLGDSANSRIKSQIISLINSRPIGVGVSDSQIKAIAINNGATNVNINNPSPAIPIICHPTTDRDATFERLWTTDSAITVH